MRLRHLKHGITVTLTVAIIAVVLWIDVTTTVWQDLVILSGLAASLVTFLFTSVFIERVVRREKERKWEPVTSFVLTEILHGLADPALSVTANGHIVARQLPMNLGTAPNAGKELRDIVIRERTLLAALLATWWEFLSEAADTDDIVTHIASLTTQFDEVRDRSLALKQMQEAGTEAEALRGARALEESIDRCNAALAGAVTEIEARLRITKHAPHSPAGLSSRVKR